ncbi:MAG: xanthine dehydrogenase accessory protein XdhC [Betaproteobacteria bacterium]
MSLLQEFVTRLAQEDAVLVSVASTEGSAPRDAGAWMAVFQTELIGTLGGGHLEFQVVAQARLQLQGLLPAPQLRYALGPALGQCCGGVVQLQFERVGAAAAAALAQRLQCPQHPVALFGGGHVGRALVQVLARLPFAVAWFDSRDEIFPDAVPANVRCEHSDPVQLAVRDLVPQSQVLIMSFSHAEDLDVLAACLQRQREFGDLPYLGLIGSQTKWASFRQRLLGRGFSAQELAHVTCPIGVPGISAKEPEVIAVAVAAQLLQGV